MDFLLSKIDLIKNKVSSTEDTEVREALLLELKFLLDLSIDYLIEDKLAQELEEIK